MANPKTPRMVGRRFGDLVVLKATDDKNGPHRLYLCWVDDGGRGDLVYVQGNNLRNRGYVGKALRRRT